MRIESDSLNDRKRLTKGEKVFEAKMIGILERKKEEAKE